MKAKILGIGALTVVALLPGSPARADELLRFKSGYEMMVVSHREEGGMIIAKLEGGSEVGFPKDSLEFLEGNKPTTRTGPTPSANRVISRANTVERLGINPAVVPSIVRARGVNTSAQGTTMGFSFAGQTMQRFSGGPVGDANGQGKIGMNIWDVRNNELALPDPDPRNHGTRKTPVKKLELSGTASPEGE